MSNTLNGLVVPIRVEALTISNADTKRSIFSVPSADFSRLPAKGVKTGKVYISQSAQNQPFDDRPLAEGIYLQWQLPKALRRVATGDDGSTEIPDAPDRWLVIRTIVNKLTGQTAIKTWVLESNYLSTDADHSLTSVPWNPDNDSPNTWRYLGRVYEYDDWMTLGSQGKYYAPLNATGYGILDFAGAYQNSANVFGMYDGTLNSGFDLGTQTLGYTVIGWYSNSANDPLSKQSINGSSNSFGWIFADDNGTLSPSYMLLQGSVLSVGWNPSLANGYFPDANDPANLNLSIGNTAPEALSAMVRWLVDQQGDQLKNVERLMNAVQIGSLQELGQPGGLARFEQALFGAEFGGYQGGQLWDIQPVQGQTAVPVAASIGPMLRQLNQKQDSFNIQQQQYFSLAQQIFEDWTKFMIIQHMGPSNQYPDLNGVYSFLNSEISSLNELSNRLDQATNEIDQLTVSITTALPDTMQLVNMPSPRYYRPNDPVLLFSGKDVPNIPPDSDETIICVLTSKLITTINFPADLVQGSVACSFDASWLPSFGGTVKLPPNTIDKAWRASLLVNGDVSPLLTTLLAQNGGAGNPASINRHEILVAITDAQQQWLQTQPPQNGITFNGPTPQGDIYFTLWKIPWNPVAISWAFDFYPLVSINRSTGNGYPGDTVIKKLAFDRQSFDYQYPEGTHFSDVPQMYQASVLLSSGATVDLRAQIEQYLRYNEDEELQEILKDIQSMPALAQALGGFHDALTMQELSMQLPVSDPAAINRTYSDFSNNFVAQAVGNQNQHTPQPSFAYNPFRAGKAVLRRLSITDSFGRRKIIDVKNLIVSETLPYETTGIDQPPTLLLPARLAQGSQLYFRWLSAADNSIEMSSHFDDSPICGWIVPNHLDNSLIFYDGTGKAIGSMFASGDGSTLFWMDAPGGALAGTDIEQSFINANSVLRSFALATWNNGPAYVQNIIKTFDRAKTYIVPDAFQQDASTSVLVGTPMALVQTSLRLSLMGYPDPDQSYTSLKTDMNKPNPLDRSVFGFTDISFPVLLGSLSELNDGLYGFFLPSSADPTKYDFGTFYSDAAVSGIAHIVAPQPDTLTLKASMTDPVNIAMLINPLCEVHAYTGILPVKTITIPAAIYASVIKNLLFSFLTAPVIWTRDGVALPLPAEGDGKWSWTQLDQTGWQNHDVGTLNQKATLDNAVAADEGWLILSKNDNP